MKSVLYLLSLAFLIKTSSTEWFSSIGQMEHLILKERRLLRSLKGYIDREEANLGVMKDFLFKYRNSVPSPEKTEEYLSHPISQFKTIKRAASQWISLSNQLHSQRHPSNLAEKLKNSYLPTMDDLRGAVDALLRLQETYKLDVHDLSNGKILGEYAFADLSLDDMYYIGRVAYFNRDYELCYEWMSVIRDRVDNSSNDTSASGRNFAYFDVLDHIAFIAAHLGNFAEAYNITEEMLRLEPDDARLQENLSIYMHYLRTGSEPILPENNKNSYHKSVEFQRYMNLCWKGEARPGIEHNLLQCEYHHNNHPFLLLQPLKVEVLSENPQVVMIHDFVSGKEIEHIKTLAHPYLARATVHNVDTGKLENAKYRVQQTTWIDPADDQLLSKIQKRIMYTTGLNLETAETFQIGNYGMGGQYEPHYDYSRNKNNYDESTGNRIATLMIYLSDVKQGGKTAFLGPGIGVSPKKGSALFWYNLRLSGEPEPKTRHAGCPVVTGTKWVLNQWFRERGQEFAKKCDLDEHAPSRLV